MRNKKTVYICVGLLLATVGCSKSNADLDAPTVDRIDFDDVLDSNTEEKIQQSDITQLQADYAQPQSDNSRLQSENEQSQSDSELDGNIESIGDNSVVINKTFHPSANEAVSYGGSEKVLVTVYFSVETEFEV
ncbi:MAG: hypothetical protein NC416_12735, partial [Eubacterium sp.]|nr:hypothetical protein [Eubacterium sp.]